MIKEKPAILVVDDEKDMLKTYKNILKSKYRVITSDSGKDALSKAENADLVILDIRMPKMDGLEVLKQLKKRSHNLEVIMSTASKDIASAVEAMKLGASDYITKPFDVKEFLLIIEKALEKRFIIKENIQLKEIIKSSYDSNELIGKSSKIENIRSLINSIAQTDSTILIQGESGTGKEIAARTIHSQSLRKNKPFIAINCAAIPENLLESELFGYERGAFTGALERKIGKFELADSGTLFLDEIGCMSCAMQSKLLRVLEDKSFERLGGNAKIDVDVRIISATNIDFEKHIEDRKFREDLFYRLNVIPIKLPPLRERKDDLPLFISFFIGKFNREFNKKIKSLSRSVLIKLQNYDFPGNVRELQNLLERAVALSNGPTIEEAQIFGLRCQNSSENSSGNADFDLKEACEDFEKEIITKTLQKNGWNQTKAAGKMGVARTTLSSRLKALGIKEKAGL